jgi:hypothetical protein
LTFTGGLSLHRDLAVTLEGGYDGEFISNPGYSVISGGMTIADGSAEVENLVIR